MATVINTRDVLLLAASPRLLWTGVRGVKVAADAAAFSVTNAGVSTPTTINLTATLNGVNGTINWTVPFGTATLGSSTGSTTTLLNTNMSSKVVTVRATVVDGGVTYTDNFTISKVVDGNNGTNGVDSKYVIVSVPSQVFSRDDEFSTYAPTSIVISSGVFGGTASSYQWQYYNGATWVNISGATTSSYTVNSGDFTDARTYRLSAVVSGTTCTDEVTLIQVTGGTNALNGFLTNESIAFSTDTAGTTPANIATLTAGFFKVYWGAVDVTAGCTFSKTDTNCTTSITNGTGAYSATAVTADNAYADYIATHTATGMTFSKRLSLGKAKTGAVGATGTTGSTGAAGTDAKLMSMSATSQVFQISKANVASPSSISLKAIRNNITGATFSVISGTATLTGVSGDDATLTFANMSTDVVTIRVIDGTSTYSDTITIVKVREGIDAISGYLTNESVTLPADTAGTIISYSGASGSFIVYYGAVDVTASCTFAVQANPDSLTPTNSIVTSGASAGQYSITGGLSGVNNSSVTYRATYTNAFGSVFTLDKVFSLSKSKTGTTGATGTTGTGARIAYVKTTGTLSTTPTTSTVSGDNFPSTGTWGESNAWQNYPPTIVAGEQVWQTTGTYNYLTNQTVWVVPYLSNLKVGTLSAIVVNTGTLTVDASGYIKGGQTAYNTGTGFWLGYDTSTYKFSLGSSSQGITWDGSALTVKGNFQVNTAAISGTTMTGSGAQFNSAGTFALGNSSGNIVYNGTSVYLNGQFELGGALTFRASATTLAYIGTSGIALYGTCADSAGQGVQGSVSGAGGAKGVYGLATNSASYGVYGESNTGTAVYGYTTSGKAIYGTSSSSGFAGYFDGKVKLVSTTSPLDLNGATGTSGQVLTSAGSSSTPTWGRYLAGGAGTADASGLYTASGLSLPDATCGISAISTTGNYVVIDAITSASGTISAIRFKVESRSAGTGVSGAAVRWTAIG
jgi:hypothetical protein